MVPGMHIHRAELSVCIEDTACTTHGFAVERTVIDIDAVDSQVVDHPVEPFEVVVVPAGYGIGNNCNIELSFVFSVEESGIPGRDVVFAQVVDQPGAWPFGVD